MNPMLGADYTLCAVLSDSFCLPALAFIAGLFTFLAPCTLPLVPAYLGFISGASLDQFKDPKRTQGARRAILQNSFFYVSGFSFVFIVFGVVAGLAGIAFAPYRIWLTRLSGVVVIIFGLMMLNILRFPMLSAGMHIKLPAFLRRGTPLSSFSLGAAFAFGWTPCVGPILGTVLLLTSTTATAFQGAFLLFMFSLGLAVPFFIIALGIGSAARLIARFRPLLTFISFTGGLLLIGIGVLLLTNNFSMLISYGYRIFRFIEYERLLDYL